MVNEDPISNPVFVLAQWTCVLRSSRTESKPIQTIVGEIHARGHPRRSRLRNSAGGAGPAAAGGPRISAHGSCLYIAGRRPKRGSWSTAPATPGATAGAGSSWTPTCTATSTGRARPCLLAYRTPTRLIIAGDAMADASRECPTCRGEHGFEAPRAGRARAARLALERPRQVRDGPFRDARVGRGLRAREWHCHRR